MHKNHISTLAVLLALGGIPACASTDSSSMDKAPEAEAPADGKLDGVSIADHGLIALVETSESRVGNIVMEDVVEGVLSRSSRTHAWQFVLDGEADFRLSMSSPRAPNRDLDTVMYLYRQSDTGSWGRYIRRNDDRPVAQGFPYLSEIEEGGLQEGVYRVVIKGYDANQSGLFHVHAHCEGEGCTSAPESSCFVGGDTADIDENSRYSRTESRPITSNTRVNMLLRTQILTAVNNHARTLGDDLHATSVSEVLEYVDRDSLVSWDVEDVETGRSFTAIDFTMGDTPVGSIYEKLGTEVLATISDGQIIAEPNQDLCQ